MELLNVEITHEVLAFDTWGINNWRIVYCDLIYKLSIISGRRGHLPCPDPSKVITRSAPAIVVAAVARPKF
jgi:hypothetical protein